MISIKYKRGRQFFTLYVQHFDFGDCEHGFCLKTMHTHKQKTRTRTTNEFQNEEQKSNNRKKEKKKRNSFTKYTHTQCSRFCQHSQATKFPYAFYYYSYIVFGNKVTKNEKKAINYPIVIYYPYCVSAIKENLYKINFYCPRGNKRPE